MVYMYESTTCTFSQLQEYRKLLEVKRTFGREKLNKLKLKLQEEKRKQKIVDFIPKINIIIKGDVAGSVEALLDIFDTYKYDTICRLNIVHYGIGPVTNWDIELADTFKGNKILKKHYIRLHIILNYLYFFQQLYTGLM